MQLRAVLDIQVSRFGPGYGPFLPFAWAVFVYRPFWYRHDSFVASASAVCIGHEWWCTVDRGVGRGDVVIGLWDGSTNTRHNTTDILRLYADDHCSLDAYCTTVWPRPCHRRRTGLHLTLKLSPLRICIVLRWKWISDRLVHIFNSLF